jgi:hypothetical protein
MSLDFRINAHFVLLSSSEKCRASKLVQEVRRSSGSCQSKLRSGNSYLLSGDCEETTFFVDSCGLWQTLPEGHPAISAIHQVDPLPQEAARLSNLVTRNERQERQQQHYIRTSLRHLKKSLTFLGKDKNSTDNSNKAKDEVTGAIKNLEQALKKS